MNARVLALLLPLVLASLPAHAFDLDELEKRLATPERMQGHFRQLHWLAEREVRLHSQGRFLYQRDRQLIWLFESPSRQVLSFTPGQVAYGPTADANDVETDIEALLPERETFQRHMVDLIGGHFSALDEDYRLDLSGDSDAWQVSLHPRALGLELPLTTLTLSGGERIERLDMAITSGDTLTIRLTDAKEVVNESLVPWLVNWLTDEPLATGQTPASEPLEDTATGSAMEQEDKAGSEEDAPRKGGMSLSP
ncbi:outer membrane lipoprotein-sorting protein [Onishia taeanensis]|uniref:Outer membrane lipoprotein-sorting protein n=1 Tax=Onishia taeanensis TaxID=284577 RepID=A0A328XVW4_9GAMM|nr:outer membrane lipoprotein carrier protein LolA [Halomonas taeanensis]RAR63115.1 outer membrane lipoprotein-sorting protein [Halomonas taeanensis]